MNTNANLCFIAKSITNALLYQLVNHQTLETNSAVPTQLLCHVSLNKSATF